MRARLIKAAVSTILCVFSFLMFFALLDINPLFALIALFWFLVFLFWSAQNIIDLFLGEEYV